MYYNSLNTANTGTLTRVCTLETTDKLVLYKLLPLTLDQSFSLLFAEEILKGIKFLTSHKTCSKQKLKCQKLKSEHLRELQLQPANMSLWMLFFCLLSMPYFINIPLTDSEIDK